MKSKYLSKASLVMTTFVLFLLYSIMCRGKKEERCCRGGGLQSDMCTKRTSLIQTHNIVITRPDQPTDPQGRQKLKRKLKRKLKK